MFHVEHRPVSGEEIGMPKGTTGGASNAWEDAEKELVTLTQSIIAPVEAAVEKVAAKRAAKKAAAREPAKAAASEPAKKDAGAVEAPSTEAAEKAAAPDKAEVQSSMSDKFKDVQED